MSQEELRQTFESLLRSSISSVQLNRLVHRSIRIAAGILKSRFSRYLIILSDAGYTAESAASRCIEALFLPQQDIPCVRLTNFLRDEFERNGSVMNGDYEQLFQRCIYFTVQQNIPELLGEFDPQYRKILRMVIESIKKNSQYRRHKDFLDEMVTRGTIERAHLHLPAMPPDEIVAQLSRRASPDESTHVLLGKVFDILDENGQVRCIITMGTLVAVLRDFFHLYWVLGNDDDGLTGEELFENGDVERITEPIVEEISTGILKSYVQRRVIDPVEVPQFIRALRSMLQDLAAGNPAPWFDYCRQEFPQISYEEYRDQHRGRFEYILGSAKELFFLRCQKYFRTDFSATS